MAWAQYLPSDDPGYGFVDEATPELSLWLADESRGLGVGRALLRALKEEAHRRGIAPLSLSVEPGNVAAHLYMDERFTRSRVASRTGSWSGCPDGAASRTLAVT